MNVLEQAVSQSPYLLGDNFTAADVYVGSQVGFGLMFNTFENVRPLKATGSECPAGPPMRGPANSTTR